MPMSVVPSLPCYVTYQPGTSNYSTCVRNKLKAASSESSGLSELRPTDLAVRDENGAVLVLSPRDVVELHRILGRFVRAATAAVRAGIEGDYTLDLSAREPLG